MVWHGASQQARFRFDCPECGCTWSYDADDGAVSALRRVRAPEEVVVVPAEALDPRRYDPRPLHLDEVLDFIHSLDQQLTALLTQHGERHRGQHRRSAAEGRERPAVPAQRPPSSVERVPAWRRLVRRLLS
jgi:hypothetical protein